MRIRELRDGLEVEMEEDELEEAASGRIEVVAVVRLKAKRALVGAGARFLFYPTLLYNVVRNRFEAEFRWWDRVDQYVLLGAVPFPSDVPRLKQLGVRGVVTLNEPYETLVPTSLYQRGKEGATDDITKHMSAGMDVNIREIIPSDGATQDALTSNLSNLFLLLTKGKCSHHILDISTPIGNYPAFLICFLAVTRETHLAPCAIVPLRDHRGFKMSSPPVYNKVAVILFICTNYKHVLPPGCLNSVNVFHQKKKNQKRLLLAISSTTKFINVYAHFGVTPMQLKAK
ncbi:unnamed protein product [Urochloa humidicola]